jgi:hypothetical protein
MQSKEILEQFYESIDPWGYQSNQDDFIRKDNILAEIKGKFKRALDIGAGEGWITQDLPAKEIYALEISDNASKRLPSNVTRITELDGKYDLIIATGVLYKEYDYEELNRIINEHASGIVVTCNIKPLEINKITLPLIKEFDFPYREYVEHLAIYEVPPPTQHRDSQPQQLQPKKRGRKPKGNTDV